MSNLRASPSCRFLALHASLWVRVGAGVLASTFAVRAAAQPNPFQAWADFVTAPPAVYRGPTLPFPDAPPRPDAQDLRICSQLRPVCVHAARAVGAARVQRALAAVETALAWLDADGWPLPYPDVGRGGSADFDVYLVAGGPRLTTAISEAPLAFGELDGAVTYAQLDAALPDDELEHCAVDALAQAGLHAHDPAEAESAIRAAAAFATARFNGEYGCDGEIEGAQQAPQLGLLGDDPRQVVAGALFLSMLSRRHDGESGRFVRGVFELARQHSKSSLVLHARPTAWQALSAALDHAGESLDRAVEEFAIARYFAPHAPGALPALPRTATVSARWAPPLAKLPEHVPAQEPPLATYGSAYWRIDTGGARDGAVLKTWLRGEHGARWSFAAVSLDSAGRELGRMSAPPRRVPDSFLPIELSADTAEVVLVVTKLPPANAAPAAAGDDAHYFKLILDASTDQSAAGPARPAAVYTAPVTR